MQSLFLEISILIFVIIGLVMLSNRLRVAYPIILVIGGLALSFFPYFSNITIDPDLIFFIFLPPLLYEAAWQSSWKELWRWRRIITSFAFPIVILTSTVVAFASNALIPGFTLALGFLLGGIVSPPDAISATTIMRQVGAPRVLVSVAEGESLLNDASSLIVFRFALAAIITGQFDLTQAVGSFFLVIIMGTAIGIAIGILFYVIYRWLPTTPSIEIILGFLAPYSMYFVAEHFHFSGVLAVVAGGLLLSSKRHSIFSYQGRVQNTTVWATIGFVLNGVIFLLIGLELNHLRQEAEEGLFMDAVKYGLIISLVLIVTRLACTYGAAGFTRIIGRYITVADPSPGWKVPFAFGWSGMRGVVSLAAALSIPLAIGEGDPFPQRNMILVITFVVILVTLVFQGLTLPWVIRKLNLRQNGDVAHELEQERAIRKAMAEGGLKLLNKVYAREQEENQQVRNLVTKLRTELSFFGQEIGDFYGSGKKELTTFHATYLSVLEEQRKVLRELNRRDGFDEELIRKYLALVDLEETKIREVAVV